MKTNIKFLYITASLIGAIVFQPGCNQQNESRKQAVKQEVEVPRLLTKHGAIGTAEEQQTTLNKFNTLSIAARKDPNNMEARLKLAQIFMQEARLTGEHGYYYPTALQVIDEVLASPAKTKDNQFVALLFKGSVLLSLHQFENAMKVGKEALKVNTHNAQIYGVLVDANVELGNYKEAIKMADQMVATRPDLRSYARVSYIREIHGDVEGAIEAMSMAASAGYPGLEETAWCRLTLGHLYETYGDLENAEKQYQTTLDERPGYPFAIAALAGIAMKKKDYEKTEELLGKACDIIPEVSFYEQLAALYQETGRTEEAQQKVEEVFAMLADDEKHGHKMGMEYAQTHLDFTQNYDKALEYALKEYEARPDNIDVNQLLAMIYLKKENIDEAEKHIQKAMRTHSLNPELLCAAGLIKIKSGHEKEGKALLSRAMKSNPYQSNSFSEEAKVFLAGI
jgi:tetratricopeptide (TPR) repeat protein